MNFDEEYYCRQLQIFSKYEQKKLLSSKVAIIGCGALGNIVISCLARSGVGEIFAVDFDKVEKSNLQRQILFDFSDIGKFKIDAIKEKIPKINPYINFIGKIDTLSEKNLSLLNEYPVIIDATDNPALSLLLNKYCVDNDKYLIFGGIAGNVGNVFITEKSPCLRCFFPSPDKIPTARSNGVLPQLPLLIASIMANETLKILLGKKHIKKLFYADIEKNIYKLYSLSKNVYCPVCSQK